MKYYILLILLFILLSSPILSQTPQSISYQAVVRDYNGALVVNTQINIQISILQDSISGTPLYIEEQMPTTNENGLFSIEIGSENATLISGDFHQINWSIGSYYIKSEFDLSGNSDFSLIGISKILSVPYAFHASTADSITGNIQETDPIYQNSLAANITEEDTTYWNNKLSNYIESQSLEEVLNINNVANNRITGLMDPISNTDAVTKSYVDELKAQIEDLQVAVGLIVKDFEGNIYDVVQIGSQYWLKQNLRTAYYNNGTPISTDLSSALWLSTTEGAYCWYDNDSANHDILYGKLYNWHAVNTGNLCPSGWHVPTNTDWDVLLNEVGGASTAGGALKVTGTTYWISPNEGATDEYNFSAMPGGYAGSSENFYDKGFNGYWWTATEYADDPNNGIYKYMYCSLDRTDTNNFSKNVGASVRCVKD